jgi:O-antigen/teichoic acid export membrane protein
MVKKSFKKIKEIVKRSDIFPILVHSRNYFGGTAAEKALSFISIPIFTRLFTRTEYGILAVFSSYVEILVVIITLNAAQSVSRYYFEENKDFDSFLGSTLLLLGSILLFSVPIFIFFSEKLGKMMGLPGELTIYMLVVVVLGLAVNIYNQILVARRESKRYTKFEVSRTYIGFAISVLLVYFLKDKRYMGRIWGLIITELGFGTYFLVQILRMTQFKYKFAHIKYILFYSVPLLPSNLSGIILGHFDRMMINKAVSSSAAGIYSLGYKIALLLNIVIFLTKRAYLPDFFKFMNRKEYRKLFSMEKKVFGLIAISALTLILFSKEIIVLLADEKFHEAIKVVPIIVIGYFFYAIGSMYSKYVIYTKKTIYFSIIALSGGFLNIILNSIYIPKYGYVAGAYTTLVSFVFTAFLNWFFVKVVLRQKTTPLSIICSITAIFIVFSGLYFLLNILHITLWISILIKIILLIIFSLLIYWKEVKKVHSEIKSM